MRLCGLSILKTIHWSGWRPTPGQYATEYLQNTTKMELEVDLPGGLPDFPLSAEMRHSLFLAFEEALANALKHSGATKIRVAMSMANQRFCIVVQDNGRGFFPQRASGSKADGDGLANMRQRLAELAGVFAKFKASRETGPRFP